MLTIDSSSGRVGINVETTIAFSGAWLEKADGVGGMLELYSPWVREGRAGIGGIRATGDGAFMGGIVPAVPNGTAAGVSRGVWTGRPFE